MTRGDQKDFMCRDWKFGIAVLEVTDTVPVRKAAKEIMLELRLLKKEKGKLTEENVNKQVKKLELDFAFLFIVDIVEQYSMIVIAGGREL